MQRTTQFSEPVKEKHLVWYGLPCQWHHQVFSTLGKLVMINFLESMGKGNHNTCHPNWGFRE